MPRIIFKNVSFEDVQKISIHYGKEIADIIQCPEDWITFECLENKVISCGKEITNELIFIEIEWFKREQETQNQVASYLNQKIKELYGSSKEITIIFSELKKENYYEEGKHF